ncbi:hypothetical protein DL765_010908 [Monosporascus sp. GIB2]|nr:hypothetical protein DL765_010908 [Monosporascus sp. GIB2]
MGECRGPTICLVWIFSALLPRAPRPTQEINLANGGNSSCIRPAGAATGLAPSQEDSAGHNTYNYAIETMSEVEVEMSSSVLASHNNLDRRTPRFSWSLAYEETFFRSLCESMQLGYKENHSFKAAAWERAAIALRDKHGAYPEKSHLINKADNARKKFRMWRGLREDPEFLYNPTTKTVTASEEAWLKHFEKEPLSKALRGRPFEHEEYLELLFPDVIGSGGAPKRIMKPRRRNPDATPSGRQNIGTVSGLASTPKSASQPSQAPIDPFLDPSTNNPYSGTPSRQPHAATLDGIGSNASGRPASNTIPPLSSITPASNNSALTPPDEHAPQASLTARKRNNPDAATGGRAEKRRSRPSRFSADFYDHQPGGTSASRPQVQSQASSSCTSSFILPPRHATTAVRGAPSLSQSSISVEDGLFSLAEALRARSPPKWQEQAVEILFRDFENEDMDLQLKIAEKALTDENKAMVFVKMTPALRMHWVGRLREVHQRNLGGGLGRVGEEAS